MNLLIPKVSAEMIVTVLFTLFVGICTFSPNRSFLETSAVGIDVNGWTIHCSAGVFSVTVHDANSFMDYVLDRTMPEFIHRNHLDVVGPYSTHLDEHWLLHAEMQLVNITGLGKIRRHGSCSSQSIPGPRYFSLHCEVVLEGISITATSNLTYQGKSRLIGVYADIVTNYGVVNVTSALGQPPTVNFRLLQEPYARVTINGSSPVPLHTTIEGYKQEVYRVFQRQLYGPYLINLRVAVSTTFPFQF